MSARKNTKKDIELHATSATAGAGGKAEPRSLLVQETQSAKREERRFPIVGIGASAGGLAAFEAFFSAMPADTKSGMAFAVVQHLASDHKSILSELIKHYTRMPVLEVEDGMPIRPKCVYIIPPNWNMAILNGTLQLIEPNLPFSKLDLISCRNLLIYMNADLQKKIIPLFHYALNPGGALLMAHPRPWESFRGFLSR